MKSIHSHEKSLYRTVCFTERRPLQDCLQQEKVLSFLHSHEGREGRLRLISRLCEFRWFLLPKHISELSEIFYLPLELFKIVIKFIPRALWLPLFTQGAQLPDYLTSLPARLQTRFVSTGLHSHAHLLTMLWDTDVVPLYRLRNWGSEKESAQGHTVIK